MIRTYTETDLEDVMSIWFEAQTIAHPFLAEGFVNKVKELMRVKFLPNSNTWIYEFEGHVIGFIAMMGNEIGGLFVSPKEQSRGTGTLLVNHVKSTYESIEVEVFKNNAIGTSFYKKYGFIYLKEYLHEETNEIVQRLEFKTKMSL